MSDWYVDEIVIPVRQRLIRISKRIDDPEIERLISDIHTILNSAGIKIPPLDEEFGGRSE